MKAAPTRGVEERPAGMGRAIVALFCLVSALGGAARADEVPLQPHLPFEGKQRFFRTTNYYDLSRSTFTAAHQSWRFCSDIALNQLEQKVNERLVARRDAELDAFKGTSAFPGKLAFALARPIIQTSEVFRILQRMPKGGALHVHNTAAGRVDWVLTNVTYRSDCYVRWPDDTNDASRGTLSVLNAGQIRTNAAAYGFPATLVRSNLLQQGRSFDAELRQLLTLGPEDVDFHVWTEFLACFGRFGGLLNHEEVFIGYYTDAFETLAKDGVQYLELRTSIPQIVRPDGQALDATNALLRYIRVRDDVRTRYPEFDLRLILCDYRGSSVTNERSNLLRAVQLRGNPVLSQWIVGYDLIGCENDNTTLAEIPALFTYAQGLTNHFQTTLPLFLHAGESRWPDDDNLIDAVLLRSFRIGHGFNLFRFPELERFLKHHDTAVEVCPISNQSLHLVADLRVHPAAGYLNRGVQCVLSSDDPFIFTNDGLSYDFWQAVIGWSLDLPALKKLALNSITYSALTAREKESTRREWQKKWSAWLDWVMQTTVEPEQQ